MEVNKVVGQWKQPVFIHCLLRLGVGSMQEWATDVVTTEEKRSVDDVVLFFRFSGPGFGFISSSSYFILHFFFVKI
jgi:hypothetical protein